MRLQRKDVIFIILLLSLWIIFFGTLVFTDATFHYRDIAKYYYPTKFFTTESIQNGEMPFWDPYLSCGNPFLAILQQGLFYPLSLLCYLLPFNLGFKYFFIIHFFLAGLFLYLLMRKLRIDSYCSFMTAVIFIFSGYLVSLINLLTSLCAVIWAPLIFLFFSEAIQRKSYFFSILVGLILSWQFFAGQPEVLYMTVLMSGLYWVFYVFYSIKEQKLKALPELKKTSFIIIPGLIFFFLISLIQMIPFLELVKYSSRKGGIVFDYASYWSFHPLELVTLVIPYFSWNFMGAENWFSQYWLRSVFIGIWPIMLVFFALWFREEYYKKRIFFFILLILSLILSLGKYTPVYYILYKYIPAFNLIRYPVKFMFLVSFSLVVLSGMGLQYLIDWLREKKDLVKLMKTLVIIFVFSLFGLIIFYFKQTRIATILTKYFLEQFSGLEFIMLTSIYLAQIIQECSFLVISLGIGILLIFLKFKNKLKLKEFQFLFGIIIFVNLALVNFNTEPMIKTQFYQEKGKIVEYVKGEGRILLTPKTFHEVAQLKLSSSQAVDADIYIDRKALLLPNIGWIYHLFDAGGYATIYLNRYQNFVNLIKTQPTPSSSCAINLMGIKYIISLWELDDPNLTLYAEINYVKIYKNKNNLSRVSIIPRAVFVYDEYEILRKLRSPAFNPTKEVIIETQHLPGSTQFISRGPDKKEEGARITNYKSNEVDVEADLTKPGWLLLTDTYYPGWKVYIDGRKGKIYQADYLFRGIYLDQGKHKIKFVYEPTFFRLGLSVTVLAILVLGLLGGYELKKKVQVVKDKS